MAITAFGTLLKRGNAATPETFTTIAEVGAINGPGISLDAIEVTHHSSTGGWREFIGGLLDMGEITFEVNFAPTGATHGYSAGLILDLKNKTVRNFQLVFPDTGATTWSFSALVTRFESRAPVDNKLVGAVTLRITGQPTLA